MQIDHKAPLQAQKEIIINAPVEKVWRIQTDINNWPKWQKEVSKAKLLGKLSKGTTFTWKAMGMPIVSELQAVDSEKLIGWTGRSIGMFATHYWKFNKKGSNTLVQTEESLSGWFPRLIKIFKPNFLDSSLEAALQTLKHQSEL